MAAHDVAKVFADDPHYLPYSQAVIRLCDALDEMDRLYGELPQNEGEI